VRRAILAVATIIAFTGATCAFAAPVLFSGARLIADARRPAIESADLLIDNGHVVKAGPKGSVKAPVGTLRVDLSGKTIIPALINAHVHIGYEAYTSWGPENYTEQNVLDHLEREAFYGVGATQTVGSSPTEGSIQFQQEQRAGKFPPASRFFFMPGMAPPNGGPDEILRRGTSALHAVYEVSTAEEARAAVQGMAAKNLKNVKIWVDDRRGTYPKMTPEVYHAIIDEAHKHRMLVHAHATTLADQKAVVRAGADVLVHIVATAQVDEELLGLIRERKPWWTPVMALGDRSEVCNKDPFVDQALPPQTIASIRESSCGEPTEAARSREAMLAWNFPRMIGAGARLVLGTDSGISSRSSFGWADHHELSRYVQLGLTPREALVAATVSPAALMEIRDMGTLEAGKSADFMVLEGNPLDDIAHTRKIAGVFLRGEEITGGHGLSRPSLLGRSK
jgi:imidazolonepropionase-like amidohydrolase